MPGKKNTPNKKDTDISPGILDLLDKTFPDGVVEMTITADESYLADLCPKLRAKLWKMRGAELLYEREPEPEPEWDDDDDSSEDPPRDAGLSASYHVFFLGLAGAGFNYQTETEGEDEDGNPRNLAGEGRIGCALAVCALAPLAVIRFTQMEQFEDGSFSLPDIWDHIFSLEGQPIDPEVHFQETFGSQAVRSLTNLRKRMSKVLESLGIAVLPQAEARMPVPWLEAAEEVCVGNAFSGKPITVQEAFFFQFV